MTIDDYLDAAIHRANLPSDRQLGFKLGLSAATISQYRTKRIWPDDETMLKLTTLGGLPADQALIDLNIWRAKNSDVIALYQKIATAVSAACFAFVLLTPQPGTAQEHTPLLNSHSIHYATLLRWLRRRFARFVPCRTRLRDTTYGVTLIHHFPFL